MSLDPLTLLAIAAMALVTYATRVSGWLVIRRIALTGRAGAGLEAIPGAVLAAVIAPMVLAAGPAEAIAALATAVASLRLPRLIAVAIGVGGVVALRAAGL